MKIFFCLLSAFCLSRPLIAGGVCERSEPVVFALSQDLGKKCDDIQPADLAKVTELRLPHIHINAFMDNDFVGLTNLRKLVMRSLFHNWGFPTDPISINEKVFADLSSLEELHINTDQLGLLPDGVFSGLTGLKYLNLMGTSMSRLPASLLTLPKIEEVRCHEGLGLLPVDFSRLKAALGSKLITTR